MDHAIEISSTYVKMKVIDMMHSQTLKHYEDEELGNADEAKKSQKHLLGEQIHGQKVTSAVLAPGARPFPIHSDSVFVFQTEKKKKKDQ